MKYSYPFPSPFHHNLKEENSDTISLYRTYFYMGLSLNLPSSNSAPPGSRVIDLTPAVSKFIQLVKDWPPKGTEIKNITADIKIIYLKQ